MTESEVLSWLDRHHALVNFSPGSYTVWIVGRGYQVGKTLSEAIEAMRNHMTVIDVAPALPVQEASTMMWQVVEPKQLLLLQGSES
ncbi:MAG TPA: hypothetical protein VFA10_14470 [Ktedonobacteraceae bacterium]|nr:hypothetical protein [Ktedonobacteraceae bacterium]